MRSSAECTSSDASSGSIVRIGKKPYATVPNASRSQWLSVNPARQMGTARAPGSTSRDERRDRVPERAVRAASACRPGARATPARSRPRRAPRADRGSASAGVWPGSSRQSTVTSHSAGITFRRLRRGDHRRRDGQREQRLHQLRPRAGRPRATRRAASRPAAPAAGDRGNSASTSGIEHRLRPERGQPLDQRGRLDERVVGDPRHRRVPAAAAHAEQERRAHLLRGRAEVERPPANSTRSPPPSLMRVLGAHRLGMRLAEPLRGRSRRRPPRPRAATKIRSPAGRKPSRASEAMATALHATWPFMSSAPRPQISPSPQLARPRIDAATRPGRRAPCRCARAGAAAGRRRARGCGRRGSPAPASARTARRRRRSPRGRRAGARRPRVSLPGGLTVSSGAAPGGAGPPRAAQPAPSATCRDGGRGPDAAASELEVRGVASRRAGSSGRAAP